MEKVRITRQALAAMDQALLTLSRRFLPGLNSELKVGRFITIVNPQASREALARNKLGLSKYEDAKEKHKVEDFDKLPKDVKAEINNYIIQAQMEWDNEEIEIDLPTTRISMDDLPKERELDKDKETEKRNDYARAEIIAQLGILFKYPSEE